jgi:glyoxylase-like metal-dependent hydrolase (beta-lactamase superfamily II)
MNAKISSISLGFGQCYLIQGDGLIAVDAGAPGKGKKLLEWIDGAGIDRRELQLIILSHGHWDHIGSAREIQEATGARIVMHEEDAQWLEESSTPLSPGITSYGRMFNGIMELFMPLVHVPAAEVNIKLGNEDFPLYDYGIPGKVVHTPGHTAGSVSILLDSGEVFVGDLLVNKLPLSLKPRLSIFAQSENSLRKSWEILLEKGAQMIYPAHGKPFPASAISYVL